MADKPGNAPTQQQVNDAQHLDNMTSLQQPSAAEQSPITQNGEVRGDAPVSAPPTPNPDNPSLFNEPKNPNNKVVEVESQKTTEFLEEGGVSDTPSDQGSKFTEDLKGLSGDAINLTIALDTNNQGAPGDKPPELDPGVNKAGGNSGNQGPTGGGGIPRPGQAPAGTPAAASPASPTSPTSQPNNPTQTVEPPRNLETAPPPPSTPPAPNPVTPQPLFVPEFVPEEAKVDQPSILAPDSQTIAEDSTAVGNVLTNDSDEDSVLEVTSFSLNGATFIPGQIAVITGVGTVTIAKDGAYLFTPDPNWNGVVPTIEYATNTEKQSTLNITVTPVEDGFTDNNETISVAEDSGATTGSVLTGTSSVDGPVTVKSFVIAGSATVHAAGETVTIADKGEITLNADGTYSFTPAPNYNGSFPVITYALSDDGGFSIGDTSTLVITVSPVNDAPDAINDSVTTAEDTAVTIAVRGNDTDPENDPLTVTATTDGAHGTVTIDLISGNPIYTPAANYNGIDSFNYTISDGYGGTDTATVNVTVNPVDDTVYAKIAVNAVSVAEGGALTYTVSLVDATGAAVTLPAGKSVDVALNWSGVAAGGADTSTLPNSVTINAISGVKTFTVSATDDYWKEGSEPLIATITSVTDTDSVFENTRIASGSVGSAVANSAITDTVESDSGTEVADTVYAVVTASAPVSEQGGTLTYTVTLKDAGGNTITVPSGKTVTLDLSWGGVAIDADVVESLPTSVTIAAGTSSTEIVLTGKDDYFKEGSESLTLTVGSASANTAFENVVPGTIANGYSSNAATAGSALVDESTPLNGVDGANAGGTAEKIYAVVTASAPVSEQGGTLTYTVTLKDAGGNTITVPSGKTVTLDLSWGGVAIDADVVESLPTSVTIAAGTSSTEIVLTGKDDYFKEGSESLTLTVGSASANTAFENVVPGTIANGYSSNAATAGSALVDESTPLNGVDGANAGGTAEKIYAVVTASAPVSEQGGTLTYTVTLKDAGGNTITVPSGKTVTLDLSWGGVAIDADVVESLPTSVTIAAGTSSTEIVLTGKDDYFKEGSESLTLTVGSASANTAFENVVPGTIANGYSSNAATAGSALVDESTPLNGVDGANAGGTAEKIYAVVTASAPVSEQGGTLTYTVTLKDAGGNTITVPSGKTVTLDLSWGGVAIDADVVESLPTSVTIAAGTSSTEIVLTGKDDYFKEGSESLTLTVGSASANTAFENVVPGTIANGYSSNAATAGSALVDESTPLNGVDGANAGGTAEKIYAVVTASAPVSEQGGTLTYTVTLKDAGGNTITVPSGKTVTLDLSWGGVAIDADVVESLPTSVTIAAGTSSTEIVLTGKDDYFKEGSESLTLTVGSASANTAFENVVPGTIANGYSSNAATAGSALVDESTPLNGVDGANAGGTAEKIYAVVTASAPVSEQGGTLTYTVTLKDAGGNTITVPSGKTVTLDLSWGGVAIDADVVESLPTSVTIAAGTSSTEIVLTGKDDYFKEGSESLTLTVGSASANTAFENVVPGTIANGYSSNAATAGSALVDESTPLNGVDGANAGGTAEKIYAVVTASAPVSEQGGTLTYTVTLKDAGGNTITVPSGKTVTLDLSWGGVAIDADVVESLPTSVTIAAGTSSTEIVLTGKDDYFKEGSESLTLTVGSASANTAFENVVPGTIANGYSSNAATAGSALVDESTPLNGVDGANAGGTAEKIYAVVTASAPVSEQGGTLTYTVTLKDAGGNTITVPSGKTVTLDLSWGGVAIDADVVESLPTSVTIAAGTSSTEIVLTGKDDYFKEGSESLTLTVGSASANTAFENVVPGTIANGYSSNAATAGSALVDESTPLNGVDGANAGGTAEKIYAKLTGDATVVEGESATYTVSLVDATGNPVKLYAGQSVAVTLATADGTGVTAIEGADYVSKDTNTLTITGNADGVSTKTFIVSTTDDCYTDNGEKYLVSISSPSSSTFEAIAVADATYGLGVGTVETTIIDETADDATTDPGKLNNDQSTITLFDPEPVRDGTNNVTIVAEIDIAVTDSPLVITLSNGATITIPVGEKIGVSTPFAEDVDVVDGTTQGSQEISIVSVLGGNYEALNIADKATVVVQTPELTLYKSAIVTDTGGDYGADRSGNFTTGFSGEVDSAGDVISYTLTVKNTGQVPLTQVVIYDQLFKDLITVNLFDSLADESPTLLSVQPVTTAGVVSYFVELPASLPVGEDYLIKYDYVVTPDDVNRGYIENTAVIDSDLTNPLAITAQTQDYGITDGIAYAQVGVANLYDVAINKYANVNAVSGVGSEIKYQIYVSNEGTGTLSEVKVEDQMFASASDQAGVDGKQIAAELHTLGADGGYDVTNVFYTIDGYGLLNVGTLAYGQYAVINYEHIVSAGDYTIFQEGIQKSIFDYANIGDKLDQVQFSYGTFDAYVNKADADPYSTVFGEQAKLFFNHDNTGIAVGVNAGVMAGDRNGNSDHLRAVFNPNSNNGGKSVIEGVSIAFTNAKDVELAFKVTYGDPAHLQTFNGSIVIGNKGSVTLREIDGADPSSYQLNGFSSKSGSTYSFVGSDIPDGWFTVTEASGPGGAQNKIYTLNFVPGTNFVNSFDFSVVGDSVNNSADQIKVVDVKFDSINFIASNIDNTATVYSDQDNASDQSDEIAKNSILVTGTVGSELTGIIDTDILAPTIASTQSFSYSENQGSVSAVIATVAAADNVRVTTFRFSDSKSSISADGFYQINSDGQITLTAAGLASSANDFEVGSSLHTLSIQAKDAAGNWSITENIDVTELNVAQSFSIANSSATEGGAVTFTVTRTGDAQAIETVDFATSLNTTATDKAAHTDFVATSGTVTFNAGETTKTITVASIDDYLAEKNEVFDITLSNATGGATIGTAKAQGTILDETANDVLADTSSYDDNDAITIKVVTVDSSGNIINGGSSNSVLESASASKSFAYYKVMAFDSAGNDVTSNITTGNVSLQFNDGTAFYNTTTANSDYLFFQNNGTTAYNVSYTAGVGTISSIAVGTTIRVWADSLASGTGTQSGGFTEGAELFRLKALDLTTANNYEKVSYGDAVTTSIGDSLVVSSVEVNEDSTNAGADTGRYVTFNVTYSSITSTAISLSLTAGSATAGSDYVNTMQYFNGANWTNLTSFTPGTTTGVAAGAGTLQVRVLIVDDALADSGETFTLTATRGGVSSVGTATIIDSTADDGYSAGNLTDNDVAYTFKLVAVDSSGAVLSNVSANSMSEESVSPGNSAYYKVIAVDGSGVALETQPTGKVIVAVGDQQDAATPSFDYASDMRREVDIGVKFSVTAVNDVQKDTGETLKVSLISGTYSDAETYEKIVYDTNQVTTTITDNDTNPAVPVAKPYVLDIVEGASPGASQSQSINTNLVIVIDVSGSMGTTDSGTSKTRLAYAKEAASALIDKYASLGNVSIQVVSFSSTASNKSGGVWVDAATAKTQISALSASGYTNYDRAVDTVMSTVKYTAAGVQAEAQNVSYFLSDGAPTEDSAGARNTSFGLTVGSSAYEAQDIGIQSSEEWAWKNYLNSNEVVSNAIAIGKGMTVASTTYLDPIAWNGVTVSNSNATLISDISTLTASIVPATPPEPVATSYSYNLLAQAQAESGPDGWLDGTHKLVSVLYGGTTYIFSDTNPTYTFNIQGGSLQISQDGSYTFSATTTNTADNLSSVITYTIQDSKYDVGGQNNNSLYNTSTSTFTINILDRSDPVAVSDVNFAAFGGGNSATILQNFEGTFTLSPVTSLITSSVLTSANKDLWLSTPTSSKDSYTVVSSGGGSSSSDKSLKITEESGDPSQIVSPEFSISSASISSPASVSFDFESASGFGSGDSLSYQLFRANSSGGTYVALGSPIDVTVASPNLSISITQSGYYRLLISVDESGKGASVNAYIDNIRISQNSAVNAVGNILTNDSAGSEGAVLSVQNAAGTWINVSGSTALVMSYGSLAIDITGAYSYTPTNASGINNFEAINYKLTQADGDVVSSKLNIYLFDAAIPSSLNGVTANILGTAGSDTLVTTNTSGAVLFGDAGSDTITGNSGNDLLVGGTDGDALSGAAGVDVLVGGTGSDSYSGGTGADRFIFSSGDSGQTGVLADSINDYTVGAVNTGDVIDYSASMTVGGSTATATTTQAQISATGVATFAFGEGATLAAALADITSRFTAATDTAGEFAFFKVSGTGDYYLFISDGTAGVTANDVLIKLVGVTNITAIDLTSGNLTITKGTYNGTIVAPIAIDLNHDGVQYLNQHAQVVYDYTGQNLLQSTAWASSSDGLLALELPNNQLQISFATQAGETDLQGLAKVYDINHDNVFDAQDAGFNQFGVWQDTDSDGVVDAGEFLSLADRGIISLSLTSDGVIHTAADGDVTIYGQTTYTMTDGSTGIAEDVGFSVGTTVGEQGVDGVQDIYQIASVTDAPIVVDHFSADDRDRIDLSLILNPTNSIHATISIDSDGSTSAHSTIAVNIGGVDYEVATLYGKDIGVEDALGTHPGGASLTDSLNGASWTDVVDISSDHGGPASIFADGGSLTNSFSNEAGDWIVQIKSGTATVDALNKQITFSSDNSENLAIITTADGTSHEITNVDKILWH